MKLNKVTMIMYHHSQMSMTTMMLLLFLAVQIAFHGINGAITCGGSISPGPGGPICNTDDDTFQCDERTDSCTLTSFNDVRGTTSKCLGFSAEFYPCNSVQITFEATDLNAQGMTCEGEFACINLAVSFPNDQKRGTLTCKGGTQDNPACQEINVYGGCLICDGPYSCFGVSASETSNGDGKIEQYRAIMFEGYVGINCPKVSNCLQDSPQTKPSLPCFSRSNTVEVQDKGLITMDSLKVGDYVKTGITQNGQPKFSPLLSFMHTEHNAVLEYLQIFTSAEPKLPIEISSNHFLYLSNNKVVCAKDVQVGDVLKGDTTNTVVTHIQQIYRQGLYAPATEDGKIWVSGVLASSYISLMDDDIVSPNKQAALSHMALAPLRMVCNMGSFSICTNESYSEDGYSTNLLTLIKFGLHFVSFGITAQMLLLVILAPVLLVLAGLEMAFNHVVLVSMMSGGLMIIVISKMKKIVK